MGMRTALRTCILGLILLLGVRCSSFDFSQIKGFNYVPSNSINDIDMWRDYDKPLIEREIALGAKMGFNFVRVFTNYLVWEVEGDRFLQKLQHFVQTCHNNGLYVMPVVFDSCDFGCSQLPTYNTTAQCWFASPANQSLETDKSWWPSAEKFSSALVKALPYGTPGLLLWDVHNEPECDGHPNWDFVNHMVQYFNKITDTLTTSGVAAASDLKYVGASVDVLSFHSYHHSWDVGQEVVDTAKKYSVQFNKQVFNSETGCIARANAYDQTILLAQTNNIGWVIWELMISDCMTCADTRRWKHGLVYSDGTIRDPMGVAAVRGFFIKRSGLLAVPVIDIEGLASSTIRNAMQWLSSSSTDYSNYDAGVKLLDSITQMMESASATPVVIPPSYDVQTLKQGTNTTTNFQAVKHLLRRMCSQLSNVRWGTEVSTGVCSYSSSFVTTVSSPSNFKYAVKRT